MQQNSYKGATEKSQNYDELFKDPIRLKISEQVNADCATGDLNELSPEYRIHIFLRG